MSGLTASLTRLFRGSSKPRPPRASRVGSVAAVVRGSGPDGTGIRVDPSEGPTVLVFLTSSCRSCQAAWTALTGLRPAGAWAVTPDAATEDRRGVAALAAGAPVVMSSEAWLDYGVHGAPWLVVVEDGVVTVDRRADDGILAAIVDGKD